MTGGFLLFSGKDGENMAAIEKLSWIKIYNEELPTPTEWTVVDSDFDSDDSVRDETGYLHRTVIRRAMTLKSTPTALHGQALTLHIQGTVLCACLKTLFWQN